MLITLILYFDIFLVFYKFLYRTLDERKLNEKHKHVEQQLSNKQPGLAVDSPLTVLSIANQYSAL